MANVVGTPLKRKEDPRLLTGNGRFSDDIQLPGMLHAAILRSPHAHAHIKKINAEAALKLPQVVAVYTGKDLEGKIGPIPSSWLVPDCNLKEAPQYPLAIDRVRYVGDGVALVIAEDRYAVRDALDLIDVEYEALPAAVRQKEAMQEGAPLVHDDIEHNIALHWKAGEIADEVLESAEVVVRESFYVQRVFPSPIETRAAIGEYNPGSGELTLWCTSQNPHIHRMVLSGVLGISEAKLRVIAPDMGGGFGGKIGVYPDEALIGYAARDLGRPVKWIEQRSEHFTASNAGRDEVIDVELYGQRDGALTAIRVKNTANLGAYLSTMGPGVATIDFGLMITGAYDIPHASCETFGVYTNTTPTDAYRGAGKPEATYQIERIIDLYAREIGMDPVELRRKNFAPKEAFPYTNAQGLIYDSGDYEKPLQKALEIVNYEQLRQEQEEMRKQGKLIGVGISTYVELCGFGPSKVAGAIGFQGGVWENSTVRVHPSGKVTVYSGTSPHGQGHATTFGQIVADKLGIPMDDIELVFSDTRAISMSWGTYGSRSTPVGGAAVAIAADRVVEKAKKIAAHELEAAADDIIFESGIFQVKGVPGQQRTFQEIAKAANMAWNLPEGMEPSLEAQSFFDPENFVYPFGTHIVVVEVDKETGEIQMKRYVCVDDVGRVINPLTAEGQVHGGIAQGVGQALWEGAVYSSEGQLLSGTLMDYTLPKARFFPPIESSFTETPSPVNPLGAKGVGETGTTASIPAVMNAVMDALKPYGVKDIDMPLTPEKVWRVIQEGEGN
ncbi:xanthine dehydrogenase family protein molybdopterin-binding subunit [Bacillus badius]|uniref:Carbon monoxide dehydrogenase large chain n=1 Tax=Bacillus badius TaxID=1455 RepID=A0ABR5AUD6_BACBA|nr:xanthine dehydrogenase family protein molybdopterin-binding subunit [Bacillus badius]KIL78366.1 Carbon monoxide dehydrogenase large chain [Bacillus badius]MED4715889.1 xanthine dehydrogenase family protein molybdopterin-binding subunit [Bacillus badius]